MDEDRKKQIDAIAAMQQRDRSFIINEAVDSYLALQRWQTEQIEKGMEQDDNEVYATDAEVNAAFALWNHKK
jgi:predicted transcriptional regulator